MDLEGGSWDANVIDALAETLGRFAEVGLVTRHEVGHALGLYHSASPADVMCGGGVRARELSPNDVDRVRRIYTHDADLAGHCEPQFRIRHVGAQCDLRWDRDAGEPRTLARHEHVAKFDCNGPGAVFYARGDRIYTEIEDRECGLQYDRDAGSPRTIGAKEHVAKFDCNGDASRIRRALSNEIGTLSLNVGGERCTLQADRDFSEPATIGTYERVAKWDCGGDAGSELGLVREFTGAGEYRLQHVGTGRYLDAYQSARDGYRVVTRELQDNDTQVWTIDQSGTGSVVIRQLSSGRFLMTGASASVVTGTAEASRRQVWFVDALERDAGSVIVALRPSASLALSQVLRSCPNPCPRGKPV